MANPIAECAYDPKRREPTILDWRPSGRSLGHCGAFGWLWMGSRYTCFDDEHFSYRLAQAARNARQ